MKWGRKRERKVGDEVLLQWKRLVVFQGHHLLDEFCAKSKRFERTRPHTRLNSRGQ